MIIPGCCLVVANVILIQKVLLFSNLDCCSHDIFEIVVIMVAIFFERGSVDAIPVHEKKVEEFPCQLK